MSEHEFESRGKGYLAGSSETIKEYYRGLLAVPYCSRLEIRERLNGFNVETVDFEQTGKKWVEVSRDEEVSFTNQGRAHEYIKQWMDNHHKATGLLR